MQHGVAGSIQVNAPQLIRSGASAGIYQGVHHLGLPAQGQAEQQRNQRPAGKEQWPPPRGSMSVFHMK
ncbi:hypothetical protein GCM10023185_31490 [Hymenobacter saemangeumensis]|uniref:Uncharacterized protein n=1 Tax=Hymenobacter saemangeumensis TaxID=1084522 RepID=A0ABP8IM60_9BACT